MNKHKNPQQNISKLNSVIYLKDHTMIKSDLFLGCIDGSISTNQRDILYKLKNKNHGYINRCGKSI